MSGNLSGGNKRKLACAISLIACPSILLLDEPTTGLDPFSRRNLVKMVKKLKNSSIIYTTHRMDEAEELCDNIAMLVKGRFVLYGSLEHIKTTYGKTDTSIVIMHIEDNFHYIIGIMPYLQYRNDIKTSSNQCGIKIIRKTTFQLDRPTRYSVIFKDLYEMYKQEHIDGFEVRRGSLEDVFVDFAKY